jgi:hypothetical protein
MFNPFSNNRSASKDIYLVIKRNEAHVEIALTKNGQLLQKK